VARLPDWAWGSCWSWAALLTLLGVAVRVMLFGVAVGVTLLGVAVRVTLLGVAVGVMLLGVAGQGQTRILVLRGDGMELP
jgi:hypothetical protein